MRSAVMALAAGCGIMVCALFAQKPFHEYPAWENYDLPLPPDYKVPAEWTFARLMYPLRVFRSTGNRNSGVDLTGAWEIPIGPSTIRVRTVTFRWRSAG